MAITAALSSVTPNMLAYLLTQDGAAGTTVDIAGASAATPDLKTDSPAGTGLGDLLRAAFLNQAEARAKLLGRGLGASGVPDRTTPYCEVEVLPTAGVGPWGVDANINAPGTPKLVVTGPAGASTCMIYLRLKHSSVR